MGNTSTSVPTFCMNIGQFFTCWNCIPPIILSCHIGLCSIPPHFLVINLHFISILTALSNPTEKIHMELNTTDIEFSTQFSRVDVQFIFTYSRSQ